MKQRGFEEFGERVMRRSVHLALMALCMLFGSICSSQGQSLIWLGTPSGGIHSWAYGVSRDSSVVAGVATDASNQYRAFRWTPAGGLQDLNFTYATLLTDGSESVRAHAISLNGRYIVGAGYNGATRPDEAFLLDTVPEPACLMAVGIGVAGLALRRRRFASATHGCRANRASRLAFTEQRTAAS